MTTSLLVAAFAMGFFGSPHCLGMCGGLVTAFGLSMQDVSPLKKRGLIATYHLGRLLSYAFLGVIASIIGIAVLQPLMVGNSLPRILLGAVLIFIGLTMLGAPFLNRLEKAGMGLWQKLSPLRQKVFPIVSFPRALAAGLLWGFLPCGLVYGALLMAVVNNNIATGALLMFVFGLGTVPMLVATHETVGWLHKQIGRFRLRQLNGVIMILSGAAVIALPIAMHKLGGHGSHGNHSAHAAHVTTQDAHHDSHSPMAHSDHMNHTDNAHSSHPDTDHSNHTMPMDHDTHHSMNHSEEHRQDTDTLPHHVDQPDQSTEQMHHHNMTHTETQSQ